MAKIISKSFLLLFFAVVICCVLYPLVLLAIGQTLFPFQSNGSIVKGEDGQPVGSLLIAQPFTKDEYFQPRPSAAGYDGTASASSALASSNYVLRDRVAHVLGPIVKYAAGPKAGQLVGSDIETWFQHDVYQGSRHIVAQWASMHPGDALAWVNTDSLHTAYVADWAKTHPDVVAQFIRSNPAISQPAPSDLAVTFFQNFSNENPGKFVSAVADTGADGKTIVTVIKPVSTGTDIQSDFFDMWRLDHPNDSLQDIPGDMVTTSASGLDPDITMENAEYQLDRVSAKWATDLKRNPADVRRQIEDLLQKDSFAPLDGLAGEKMINVLQVNLELRGMFGAPQ
ncbi:MAG TPA: potassium-transporting ATPase subunit C [Candidatus Acidoferrales bacterium]|nr:potassium-transporting ATPase subunit C [Candidatus Acidoferrales bacterium]